MTALMAPLQNALHVVHVDAQMEEVNMGKADKPTIVFLLFLCSLAVLAAWMLLFPQEDAQHKQLRIARAASVYPAMLQEFQNNHGANTWLVVGDEPDTVLRTTLSHLAENIQAILVKYRSVSDLTEKIGDTFKTLSLGICTSEDEQMRTIIDGGVSAQKVCLIPRNKRDEFNGTVYYTRTLKEVRIYGIDMPEAIFAARLEHELGHVYKYEVAGVKDDSELVEGTTDLYRDGRNYSTEEVLMGELEGKIVNFYTQGEFYKYLDEVLGRFSNSETPAEAVLALKLKDFQNVERLVCPSGCSWKPAGFLSVQTHLSLGFRFADQELDGSMDAKIEFYGLTKGMPRIIPHDEF